MNRELRRKLFWMVVVALALRLAVMAYVYPLQLVPDRGGGHWPFGYETGEIAASIAEGHGFSSPLFAPTGPTAWMTPVYPYIVAGVFKVFGVFSTASALVILTFNAITSALTCLPIFFFTRKSFGAPYGEKAGEWAGWIWAIFPYAIYWPVERIWDTWLATLLLAILFWMALHLAESNRARDWIAFGVLSGVAALTDPVVLSVLPFLALWALWRLSAKVKAFRFAANRTPKAGSSPPSTPNAAGFGMTIKKDASARVFLCAAGCVLAVILVMAPWFVRNSRVFHKFIPFRDNFGLALRVGNIGDTRHMLTLQAGPWMNENEWRLYQRIGEIAYMNYARDAAFDFIAAHPAEYVDSCIRRVVYVWTHFWPLPPSLLAGFEPNPAEIFLFTGLTILALMGLRDAFRKKAPGAAAYTIVLLLFPAVYYVTSLEPWYRVPMDPMVMALAAYAITSRLDSRVAARAENFGRGSDVPDAERYSRVNSTSQVA
ncbi:MAG TPA: glycosyltransferase family 39 protein [Candidatus Acidoferrales bacterium]|nr:glycosyltransferase family 39 protein [Candidatus Acidoferrales bacterium]